MPRFSRLILVYPPQEEGTVSVYSSSWCVNLGILSIATYIQCSRLPVDIQVLDSAVLSKDAIREKLREYCDSSTLVGFSTTILNLRNVYELAKEAKKYSATIVLGGRHAEGLASVILKNRAFIDYIVKGDGEQPILSILNGTKECEIPNLAFREKDQVIVNPYKMSRTWIDFYPDRSYIKDYLKLYKENWKETDPQATFTATNIYYQRGCDWGKCRFCTEPKGLTNINEDLYWKQIRELHNQYGFNAFFDVSPGPSGESLREILALRPMDSVDVRFRFYTYPHILTSPTIEVLRELNTWEVFIGIESGSTRILKNAAAIKLELNRLKKKKYDVSDYHRDIKESLRQLSQYNIQAKCSFIIGLEGESEKSLQQTKIYAQELVNHGASSLACSILMPLPNTNTYRDILRHPTLGPKYINEDLIDLKEIRQDYIHNFCSVPYDIVEGHLEEILRLAPSTSQGYYVTENTK